MLHFTHYSGCKPWQCVQISYVAAHHCLIWFWKQRNWKIRWDLGCLDSRRLPCWVPFSILLHMEWVRESLLTKCPFSYHKYWYCETQIVITDLKWQFHNKMCNLEKQKTYIQSVFLVMIFGHPQDKSVSLSLTRFSKNVSLFDKTCQTSADLYSLF